jgi:hypothetical protein
MKSIRPLILLAVAFGANAALAEMCWNEVVPAATLLLPYFEVDFTTNSADAVTTLVSVNNASSEAALAQVTLWSNWAQPVLTFHIYLTGYDIATINLRDVFDGKLPITASAGTDPGDTVSPKGPISEDINFPSCSSFFPYPNPVISGANFERLRDGHTGKPISALNNRCLGADLGDNIARGYITIDSVRSCVGFAIPSDPGYFVSGGTGIATNDNQLWGDYFIVDPANNFSFGDNLVHIEARDNFSSASTSTEYTFYGRYTAPSGADNREPLGTTWGVRYLSGGAFNGGTDLIVWRDTTANNQPSQGFVCGVGPDWFPLNEAQLFAFDEAEEVVSICAPDPGDPPSRIDATCLPYATGRYQFGVGELEVPFDFGWAYLNLNHILDAPTGDVDFGSRGWIAQSYVSANHSADGRFQVGLQALQLTSACEDLLTVVDDPVSPWFP